MAALFRGLLETSYNGFYVRLFGDGGFTGWTAAMLVIVPVLSRSCQIAEPPRPASGPPAPLKRKPLKTSSRHRFPHSFRLSLQAWFLLTKRDRRFHIILSRGLLAPIGGSFYVDRTTFLTRWLPPLTTFGHFSSHWRFSKSHHRAVKRIPFILGGGPPGPWGLSYRQTVFNGVRMEYSTTPIK